MSRTLLLLGAIVAALSVFNPDLNIAWLMKGVVIGALISIGWQWYKHLTKPDEV